MTFFTIQSSEHNDITLLFVLNIFGELKTCQLSYRSNFANFLFACIYFITYYQITKQFDKSCLDQLIQLGKLLLAEGNQLINFIYQFGNILLFGQ